VRQRGESITMLVILATISFPGDTLERHDNELLFQTEVGAYLNVTIKMTHIM